jgi:DNA-binding response OmpR family regulator
MPRILFVEDELQIQDTMKRFFTREGYDVHTARSRSEALAVQERHQLDVAVLDVMLNEGPEPEHDGFAVCRGLRDQGYEGPVIFVTARTSEDDKLTGFDLGADDYVTKPFSVKVLHARVEAVIRRAGGTKSIYRFGPVEVDLDNYVITHGDEKGERLSNREQELLRYLIEHRGKVLPRGELLTGIWRYSPNVTTRTVDTHILNVRKKLRDDASNPRFIETLHGVGYRFIAKEG